MKLSNLSKDYLKVLNLVISGMPSILSPEHEDRHPSMSLF